MADDPRNQINDKINIENLNQSQAPKKEWKDVILGSQFLKLYFCYMGVSNSLVVDRLLKLDDLNNKKGNEKFQFAIIKSRDNVRKTENDFSERELNREEFIESSRLFN